MLNYVKVNMLMLSINIVYVKYMLNYVKVNMF